MLRLKNKAHGEPLEPLEEAVLLGAETGTVVVRDAAGRVYATLSATPELAFRVSGALGIHSAALEANGRTLEALRFPVAAVTKIEDDGGQFRELLTLLYATMLDFSETGMTLWNGRIYKFFVRWLRDHVHTLKGMKYFYNDLKSAIDLFKESQREDGMIWDNVYERTAKPNAWDMRFSYGNFIRPYPDYSGEFKRIPVENDVEYLFIEGLYYTWKATGDDGWMTRTLDHAIKAMNYSVTDPYRWSEKHKLLKRGFTIDTWDFQNKEDAIISAGGDPVHLSFGGGDAMVVKVGHTRFGVMFGDNTGYAASCAYLAEMLTHAGREADAAVFAARGKEIKERLDQLAWNGKHYTHHVPEDPNVKRDLGVDLDAQVSLSNAYSLNRGLTHEQCAAIIRTYQGIRDHLPEGSPGEWYTIYPPFEKGYGGHNAKWQYMNAGVTPIVAGELAHGAFEHGFEAYGVDILRRVTELTKRHGTHLHCCYVGSRSPAPARTFTPLDLSKQANASFDGKGAPGVPGWTGEGENDLHEMVSGRQKLAEIDWLIADPAANGRRGCVALSPREGYAMRAEIPVHAKAASLYFLHAISSAPAGIAGSITVEYVDGSTFIKDVVRGQNVNGWWMPEACGGGRHAAPVTAVAWSGKNKVCSNVGVLAYGLDHPKPDAEIRRIVLDGPKAGGTWLVLGVTLCDAPVYFPTSPISYGIPDNWGAAAVVYALVEGLAGIKDEGVCYERAQVAPRWTSAGVDRARATIVYPASGGYVAYDFAHDAARKRLNLRVASSGEGCRCHVLLPAGASKVAGVDVNGKPRAFTAGKVEGSLYADFDLAGADLRDVSIQYA
ncbi:MAG: hypothetical protein KIS92_01520 [Planctomycetota bacterium]|nr:hypothetical protein [Planctomycetota bacterium]